MPALKIKTTRSLWITTTYSCSGGTLETSVRGFHRQTAHQQWFQFDFSSCQQKHQVGSFYSDKWNSGFKWHRRAISSKHLETSWCSYWNYIWSRTDTCFKIHETTLSTSPHSNFFDNRVPPTSWRTDREGESVFGIVFTNVHITPPGRLGWFPTYCGICLQQYNSYNYETIALFRYVWLLPSNVI